MPPLDHLPSSCLIATQTCRRHIQHPYAFSGARPLPSFVIGLNQLNSLARLSQNSHLPPSPGSWPLLFTYCANHATIRFCISNRLSSPEAMRLSRIHTKSLRPYRFEARGRVSWLCPILIDRGDSRPAKSRFRFGFLQYNGEWIQESFLSLVVRRPRPFVVTPASAPGQFRNQVSPFQRRVRPLTIGCVIAHSSCPRTDSPAIPNRYAVAIPLFNNHSTPAITSL